MGNLSHFPGTERQHSSLHLVYLACGAASRSGSSPPGSRLCRGAFEAPSADAEDGLVNQWR
ncbi:hypothetical protein EYF80_053333 [Liparis tanakae]|uniref:Uncharacterized protein n=1 Tax=Liparis tanakae TaxID=230148 RepID=A0A4Z2F5Z0_9TELE|nr:hypothetical protein EYF80_053333 [Liparis tanakae]